MRYILISFSLLFCARTAHSQNSEIRLNQDAVLASFQHSPEKFGLTPADVGGARVSDFYRDRKTGVTHAYIQQYHNSLPVVNAVIGLHYNKENKLIWNANNFVSGAGNKEAFYLYELFPEALARKALEAAGADGDPSDFIIVDPGTKPVYEEFKKYYYHCYFYDGTSLRKSENYIVYNNQTSDWWNIVLGADGAILAKISWTSHCSHSVQASSRASSSDSTSYHALSFYTESPLYGNRSILLNPHDSAASPFGWHDTNGIAGFDLTITWGNNVRSTEDHNADNKPGFSPDGGQSLAFDFEYNPGEIDPQVYQDYAITNLFVANNLIHDILYSYGFDEVSGNFQFNTYNRGGIGSDEINADCQDGSGTNNANFSTPPDGSNPRMQMYIWDAGGSGVTLEITNPELSKFTVGRAQFGALLSPVKISGKLVLVNDGVGTGIKGCNPLINAPQIENNIAAIQRGDCYFTEKAYNAQVAGAIAVVVLDTFDGDRLTTIWGNDSGINIPVVMAKFSDANKLFALLQAGTVNISLYDSSSAVPKTDSDLDLGVIAHEFGHGVSNRLTCGPFITTALYNAEQMGEGWSDYIALALTVKPDDVGSTARGIGNWLIGEDQNGNGIRTYAYSTNMAVNPHTYNDIKTASFGGETETHYVGEVWCSMLWDLHWKMIEKYGYDEDLYHGNGGNNMAIQLVIDGMKLQKCYPGFVDGRDAIIMADSINYGGANTELIWSVFARRGLGYSASQGSSDNTADGIEAFDMPGASANVIQEESGIVSIRPNPVQGILIIEPANTSCIDAISLVGIQGNAIPMPTQKLAGGGISLDMSALSPGVYILKVQAGEKQSVFKIQKN